MTTTLKPGRADSFPAETEVVNWRDAREAIEASEARVARLEEALRGPLAEVATERQRQMDAEGWTAAHDDEHTNGSLSLAAASYAYHASRCDIRNQYQGTPRLKDHRDCLPFDWPWASTWWKPKDARRDLIRAAALIVAEIERLDRAALREGGRE